MSARILIAGPWITEKEIRCVTEAVADGWYANASKYQTEFEQAFAAATGRRHAMALPSCTSGLHLALLALGVGPGDGVVVPDVIWKRTTSTISSSISTTILT